MIRMLAFFESSDHNYQYIILIYLMNNYFLSYTIYIFRWNVLILLEWNVVLLQNLIINNLKCLTLVNFVTQRKVSFIYT